MDFLNELLVFSPISAAVRLFLAALFGGLIGLERGRTGHDAGMRTHIFVALGSAMTVLVGFYAAENLGSSIDPLRISAQVVSGIGFLGAGTILVKNSNKVTGLTTAAGMWATATVGLAVGAGFYFGAAICTLICIITATLLTILESNRRDNLSVYIEIAGPENVNAAIKKFEEQFNVTNTITVNAKSNISGNVGIIMVVALEGKLKQNIIESALALDNVVMAVETE